MAICEHNTMTPQDETTLQSSEERYRHFSALTSDYVYQCQRQGDAPFRVQWMAGAVEGITGYSQDEIFALGCWLPLVHPDDRQRIAESLFALGPGDSKSDEFRLMTKTGEIHWIRESCHCEAGANAHELVLYGASQDITARKKAEQSLYDKELLLRNAQRIGHLGTYDYNIAEDSWASSPELNEIFGIPATFERSFAAWLSLIHPDDRDRMEKYFPELLAGSNWFDMEYRIIRPSDGMVRWVYGTGEFSYDSAGNPVRMIGTIQDITRRKMRDEEFQRLNLALVNLARDPQLTRHDLPTALTGIAKAATEAAGTWRVSIWRLSTELRGLVCLAGYNAVTGSTMQEEFLSQDDFPAYFAALPAGEVIVAHDANTDPRTCEFVDKYLIPNGITSMLDVPIIVEGRVYGVVCHEHRGPARTWSSQEQSFVTAISGFVATVIEMFQRKSAESVLRDINRELDRRVRERTAELEASYREQEAFSYSVSHDLRAPLRHINSFSAMLQEELGDALPVRAHNYLDRIRAASSRMGDLIDDLLQLSRVGRVEMRQGPVNLSHLAQQVADALRTAQPERKGHFEIGKEMVVTGDPTLLQIALENLLGNAWKYTGQQEEARIEFGKTELDGQAAFFVRDNGAGFDMTFANKLFQPFQRLHGQEFAGTGIGLATVRRIIERHNGKTWGEGQEGAGATFYFTLPTAP